MLLSLPTWGRGLKHLRIPVNYLPLLVAPYMGAWIETIKKRIVGGHCEVAPYMGAWIETFMIYSRTTVEGGRSLHGGVD